MTSLAKTAMAEAQKTLDKALEIQDDENQEETVIDTEFSQWGLTHEIVVPKSVSEPVSLQPRGPKENELLLKPVDDNSGPNSSALMQESTIEEIDELNSSMSSSRTTVVSSHPSSKSNEEQEPKVNTIAGKIFHARSAVYSTAVPRHDPCKQNLFSLQKRKPLKPQVPLNRMKC